MRNISFMLTTRQIIERTKTVTRRLGWRNVKVGERLQACVKCQGLKPGQKITRLAIIEVTDVRRERLNTMLDFPRQFLYAQGEPTREGFPHLTAPQFVAMFMREMECPAETEVTRIEFKYV
jgi:hypothetical protein